MSLLISLGVNSTLAFQLGIFLAVFIVLKYFLFGPYFEAFNKRAESTVGQAELAERYLAETKDLEDQFAMKAQVANERYRSVYDQTRGEALKEYDKLVSEARSKSKVVVDGARQQIQADMQAAQAQLTKEIPDVAKIINQKLLGQDLST